MAPAEFTETRSDHNDTANDSYPTLFSPLKLGRFRLKNRIAFISTVSLYGEQGCVTDRLLDYYRERALGGAAMIVTEGMVVQPESVLHTSVLQPFEPRAFAGLQRLVDAVEAEDCRLLGQLWHIGRQNLLNPVTASVGVSDQPDALSWIVPHVLDGNEIANVVEAFVKCATILKRAGFSGAELHGAHGYLITQFLSPWSNTRDDAYGGDLAGRLRFVREIIAGVRATCGRDFLLGLKMPADEGVKGGIDCAEAERIMAALAADGTLDYIAFSQGNFSPSLADHVPDMHYPPGPFLSLHHRLRANVKGLPVMALGRIMNAEHAERALAEGAGDLIGLSRPLISDAALPKKALDGHAQNTRPCIYCNICWGEAQLGKPIACFHNPQLGTAGEASWRPRPTTHRKRIMVIGSGVAGLEAAWIAAARGHDVSIFGTSADPGGKARLEAKLPGCAEIAKTFEYQVSRLHEHGAKINLGKLVDLTDVSTFSPDSIVIATGATLRPPWTLEAGSDPGISIRDFIADWAPQERRAGTALLYDHDHTPATYAAADLLAEQFQRLVLVTPRTQLARGVPLASAFNVFRRLYVRDVEIIYAHTPVSVLNGRARLLNPMSGKERVISDVVLFAYATPRTANDTLGSVLKVRGLDVRLVGDCRAPRTILSAVHEGHAAGNAV